MKLNYLISLMLASTALAMSLASFLIMIISITVTIECTIMMMPAIIMIDIDEANGLNKIIIPAAKSITPKSNNKNHFDITFLAAIAILIISILDRMIQIPSAIAKMTDRIFGIATRTSPSMMDNIPDIMPKNGV